MVSKELKKYYDSTKNCDVRPDLKYAIDLVKQPKIAIDCGCGAGSDIAYLLTKNFTVYGFDSEDESILRCKERFDDNSNVVLTQDSFASFKYPSASLLIADASLFFCPQNEFCDVWNNMHDCLYPEGIFCGSFLGANDTMAGPSYDRAAFWPNILVFDETQVRSLFNKNYEIHHFTEHRSSGKSPEGEPHEWHVFSVVAKKI